ncbi:hypothetical protein [Pontiella agarivorans]|uniref:Lipoprotein n=1 Tax=Pontiella agarivorans TaxID=3038953 RepID=A0ABU5MYT2_9BACT|nr:hypothetical protein [Pontiella agarivorans]MDZ8119348.1 hypothetical protein [Pontiella agarivorans]
MMNVILRAGLFLLLAGCGSLKTTVPKSYMVTDELIIKIDPVNDEKIGFWMDHAVQVREKGDVESRGKNHQFSIVVEPSVWARVKRSATVVGYSSETECLMGDEMVAVSGMPGENFTVKIEPLAINRFQVTGIYLASHISESGETAKTIPFDFVATPGEETTVYRKTVVLDPDARIGEEELLRH